MNENPSSSNDGISRRSFVKKSVISASGAFLLSQGLALANGTASGTATATATPTPSASCTAKVRANPDLPHYYSSTIQTSLSYISDQWSVKLHAVTTSAPGDALTKEITMQMEYWRNSDYSGTVKWSSSLWLQGKIDTTIVPCPFLGDYSIPSTTPPQITVLLTGGTEPILVTSLPPGADSGIMSWATYAVLEVTDEEKSSPTEAYIKTVLYFVTTYSNTYYDSSGHVISTSPGSPISTKTTASQHIDQNMWVWKV